MNYEFVYHFDYLYISFSCFRQQSLATGERLKALNLKFDKMTVSTMTRAMETANLIHKSFPEVP